MSSNIVSSASMKFFVSVENLFSSRLCREKGADRKTVEQPGKDSLFCSDFANKYKKYIQFLNDNEVQTKRGRYLAATHFAGLSGVSVEF